MCYRPPELNKLMHKCPICGHFNKPEAKVCKKCGAEIIWRNGKPPGLRHSTARKK